MPTKLAEDVPQHGLVHVIIQLIDVGVGELCARLCHKV